MLGGEDRIPGFPDGPRARSEPLGLLLVARERLPARRLVRRARRRDARLAGIRQTLPIQVRTRDTAAGILPPGALPSPEIDAQAGNTRLHTQREEAHHDPRPNGQASPRPDAPRLLQPRADLQARERLTYLRTDGGGGCTWSPWSTCARAWWWDGRSPTG